MEITKDFLKQKQQEYTQAAEKFRDQYVFNTGAADAISKLIMDMSLEMFTEEDIAGEGSEPLEVQNG